MSFLFRKLAPHLKYYIMKFDLNYVDAIEVDGIDMSDYPDFCDAFISYAEYKGVEMTDEELEHLSDLDGFVYDCVMNQLF